MPTSNAEELGLFLKCTVIGRGVVGPCACCLLLDNTRPVNWASLLGNGRHFQAK